MTDKIVVLSTCSSRDEAERIARQLVDKRLAACVNIVEGVRSIYRWQGAVEEASEILLIIKSRRSLFRRLREELSGMHSYQTPEIIAAAIVDGAPAYLEWLERELASE